MSSISIVGKSRRVIDTPEYTIDELAGNVVTKCNQVSVAHAYASKGKVEPYVTIHYDERICILKGEMLFESDGRKLIANGGDTVLIKNGTRFRPSFLEDTEYIPVCIPAFSPDLCTREDGDSKTSQEISFHLKELHNTSVLGNDPGPKKADVLYHMTPKAEWEAAKAKECAYFPKTFDADGFTHATDIPGRLIEVANHFYQDVEGEWICLQFRRSVLYSKYGIITKDEEAMAVGNKTVDKDWQSKHWICPHVYAGLPLACVEKVYQIIREGPKFLRIEGLTD